MNVFILCTGRSGSVSMIEACKLITNFTSGHETRSRLLGSERLNYPTKHIEADNRLSWMLGRLEKKYGDDAFYIHLKRESRPTAESFMKRFGNQGSIIRSFAEGIHLKPTKGLSEKEKLQICLDYVETVNTNIETFLKDKSKVLTMNLENIQEDFKMFWNQIEAQGDRKKALEAFQIKHNKSEKKSIFKKLLSK